MSAEHHSSLLDAVKGQPKQVWITAFAAVIAFMGIGLVDPILLSIAKGLDATPSQVTLLFSSYLGVQVIAMLVTGAASAKFGPKRTVLVGLTLIVAATALCAAMRLDRAARRAARGLGPRQRVLHRDGVVGDRRRRDRRPVRRDPALRSRARCRPVGRPAAGRPARQHLLARPVRRHVDPDEAGALVLCAMFLKGDKHEKRDPIKLLDPLRALKHTGLLRTSVASALYTAAFFTVLAWSPFVLGWSAIAVGLIFCGWGLCVAVAGVALAPRLAAKLGERHAAAAAVFGYAVLMLVLAVPSKPVLVVGIIVSGLVSGLLNTLFTGTAMSISDAPRPVASAGYNFCRWLGGAVAATLVGHVAEWFGSPQAPFVAAAVLCVVAGGLLSLREKKADAHAVPQEAALVGEEF